MNTGLATPRPHWRHFTVTIVTPALVTFALFLALIFAVIIPALERNFIERKKEMLRALTQAACGELAGLREQEKAGTISRASAQQAAIARLRHLRYGDDGKDYFWITDAATQMVMHPYRPELEGRSLADHADPTGRRLFAEHTRVVREKGEGFVEYQWQWNDDERRVVPKLSYVRGFTPWGWIVGTGVYLEDVRLEIAGVTRRVMQVSLVIGVVIAALLAFMGRQALALERQRWRAEMALRESEEKYRRVVEGTHEGVLLVLQDRPVFANPTLLTWLGYTEQELLQLPLEKFLGTRSAAVSPEPGAERHATLQLRNGESSEALLSAAPVTIAGRAGQIITVRNLAARNRAGEALARLVAELQNLLPLATQPVKASKLELTTCRPDASIAQAAAAMTHAKASALLIQSATGEPVGIVTDHDLRSRVLATGRPTDEPVSSVMSAPVVCIEDRALLFEAVRVMQDRNVRHLVVTDEQGASRGILTTTEILHTQRHALGALLHEVHAAVSPGVLRDCRARLSVFLTALLDSGARIEHLTRITTSVSDAISTRLVELAQSELGPPPAPFAFVALGSEARAEQTFATDQDNAIIFADTAPPQSAAVQAYFLRLGEKVCAWLDETGYRRCCGEVMASNPKWCQPLSQWRRYFTDCVTAGGPQDLLDVNVFFDFRRVCGDAGFVRQLRQHLHELLDGARRDEFFFHLAQSTLEFRAPRGFFGNLQLESADGHPAAFNLKSALIPLVNFARMYALRHRLAETNTLERLRRLRDLGVLLPSSHEELAQAYAALMHLRFTHQAAQMARGDEPDNRIELTGLTQIDRSVLKKIFADITVFQARLQTDFARTA